MLHIFKNKNNTNILKVIKSYSNKHCGIVAATKYGKTQNIPQEKAEYEAYIRYTQNYKL